MNNEIPVEDLTFDFLEEAIAAAPVGNILNGLQLRDTLFKKIDTDNGIGISDGDSEFELNGEDAVQEYDAFLILVVHSKILGANKTERQAARRKSFQIARAVAALFLSNPKMNGRVCRSRVLRASRGFDSISGTVYAVVNMPIVFNETGDTDFGRRKTY